MINENMELLHKPNSTWCDYTKVSILNLKKLNLFLDEIVQSPNPLVSFIQIRDDCSAIELIKLIENIYKDKVKEKTEENNL